MSEPDKEPMLGDRNQQRKIVDELNIPSVNPFMTRTPDFTPYEMVKFVIGLFTLVPLRIILVVISLILLVTVSKISISGLSDEDLKNPLPPSRRRILSLNRCVRSSSISHAFTNLPISPDISLDFCCSVWASLGFLRRENPTPKPVSSHPTTCPCLTRFTCSMHAKVHS